MKTLFFSIMLVISISFFSFINKTITSPNAFNIKEIEKSLAKVNDSLYAGKYEVSNMLYLAFEKELKDNKQYDLLKIIQIDSLNWRDPLAYNEPYVEYYYRHPSYFEYPVVNISYEAANLFCDWLTTSYNASSKRMFKKVLFRLPSESEWETAARAGWKDISYPWGYRLYGKEGKMCNYYSIGDEYIKYDTINKTYFLDFKQITNNLNDAGYITAPVISFYPNDFGMYNVCGNVAEMTNKKGVSCGGGWRSAGGDVKVTSRAHYTGSAIDLGFRYFMVVVEE